MAATGIHPYTAGTLAEHRNPATIRRYAYLGSPELGAAVKVGVAKLQLAWAWFSCFRSSLRRLAG